MANETKYNNRAPPMIEHPYRDDQTQKVREWVDGSWVRRAYIKGKELLQSFHSSGTYHEFRPDGSQVFFSSNNTMQYIKGSFSLSIDNNGDIKIRGHGRINIDHDAHIEVGKNASVVVGGQAEVSVPKGHLKVAAAEISLHSEASIVMTANRDIEFRAEKGRITHHSAGVQTFTTDSGDFHVAAMGKIDLNCLGDGYLKSGENVNISSQSNMKIAAQGSSSVNAQGELKLAAGGDASLNAQGQASVQSKAMEKIGSEQLTPDSAEFLPGNPKGVDSADGPQLADTSTDAIG